MTDREVTYRRGTPRDTRAAWAMSMAAMGDYFRRSGLRWEVDEEAFFRQLEPFLDHLATESEWWVAEDPVEGSVVGYARSVERGGLIELSELFVRPSFQSAGIGRGLIERAFPEGRGDVRVIIATLDTRALARYYRAGVVARFPIVSLSGAPRAAPPKLDPQGLEPVPATMADVGAFAAIEEAVIGYPRHRDYPWLFEHRAAFLYRRADKAVGFSFVSAAGQGPIVALEPDDQLGILLHAEGQAEAMGLDGVSFEVPMINEVAMRHLLGRGFRIEPPLTLFMSNVAFGHFDRFIGFGPGIVL